MDKPNQEEPDDYDELLKRARESYEPFYKKRDKMADFLAEIGLDVPMLDEAKAQELGLPYADLTKFMPDPSALGVIPEHVARRHNVLPLHKQGNALWVALTDPSDIHTLDDLRLVTRCTIKPVLAEPDMIRTAIAFHYSEQT